MIVAFIFLRLEEINKEKGQKGRVGSILVAGKIFKESGMARSRGSSK